MGGYVVRVNGGSMQWESRSFDEAVEAVAEAHRSGDRWDVRRRERAGNGAYRLLTDNESAALVAAVTKELT